VDLPPSPPLMPEPGPPATPPVDTPPVARLAIDPSGTPPTSDGHRPGRARDRAGVALAVLAVIALLVGSVAWWARTTLYDTSAVTAKAEEIVAQPEVQDAATALLIERVVRPALAQGYDAIPGGLGGVLQSVAGDKVEELATQGVEKAVSSQQAHDITVRLATAIQAQLVDGDGPVAFTPSEMAAIVAPNLADNRVVASVVAFADDSNCCQVVLVERDQLPFVWQYVELIRTAAIALPFAALALGVVALLVSSRRRRTGLVLALGVLFVGVATLLGVAIGGSLGIDAVADPSDPAHDLVRQAAETIYLISRRELVVQAWVITAVGAAASVALLIWIWLGSARRPVPASTDGATG
jgi:hypothetical protein